MIKSPLKSFKTALKKLYPKPYLIESTGVDNGHDVDITRHNGERLCNFRYCDIEGAFVTGGCSSDSHQKEYLKNFPSYNTPEYVVYFQSIIDLFCQDNIMNELIDGSKTVHVLDKCALDWDDYYAFIIPFKKPFDFFNDGTLKTIMGFSFQYYLDENQKISARMRIKIDIGKSGSLVLYYNYSTHSLVVGDIKVSDYQDSQTDIYTLLGFHINQPLDMDDLAQLFFSWMTEVCVGLNKQIMLRYNIDESIDSFDKNKAVEHLNILKIRLF